MHICYTHRIILGILTLVWINDTGAYLVGMSIGRHRLFERISPKKSWEGAIGGAVLTLICALWLHLIMGALDRTDWLIPCPDRFCIWCIWRSYRVSF